MNGFLYSILYIAALGVLSHLVGQLLPRAWFSAERFPYRVHGWEKKCYEALGIKRWKTKVPDMSRMLGDMLKKEVKTDDSAAGMEALVRETCVSECVHWLLIAATVPILFCWRKWLAVVFYTVYNLLGNVPYILIQRYNRPRLMALAQRKRRRENPA
jgi:glycosyl-4,4'-diaponeurosporenoate acyltransferase